jgi:RNA polymerase sigma factor (TIGR02999 family)
MKDVTILLQRWQQGDNAAAGELVSVVYSELRQMAAAKMGRERHGQTLQPTALVHEAWIRLAPGQYDNRAHFFSAASEAMRRILVDRARRKQSQRNGGGSQHIALEEIEIAAPTADDDELLKVHEALDALALHDPRKAELVKLRYFLGLSFAETADVLGVSVPTANRDWAYARAWLHQELGEIRKADEAHSL